MKVKGQKENSPMMTTKLEKAWEKLQSTREGQVKEEGASVVIG